MKTIALILFEIDLRRTKLGAGKTAPSILLALFLATSLPAAHAATLRVGPGEAITRIAEAARLAKDGDTVEILPGEYRGDVAVWPQKQLTIRGIGPRPVLIADGNSAEGKAIWVIRNSDIRIENIEFRGARLGQERRRHPFRARQTHCSPLRLHRQPYRPAHQRLQGSREQRRGKHGLLDPRLIRINRL